MAVPNRIRERLQHGLKRMVPIIQQQKARDVSEADTVTLVKDTLAEVFGYDKYTELTSEHAIRGTYCDLCVKLADKLVQLIEVKSAGSALDDRHVKQAATSLMVEIDLTTIDAKKEDCLECRTPRPPRRH